MSVVTDGVMHILVSATHDRRRPGRSWLWDRTRHVVGQKIPEIFYAGWTWVRAHTGEQPADGLILTQPWSRGPAGHQVKETIETPSPTTPDESSRGAVRSAHVRGALSRSRVLATEPRPDGFCPSGMVCVREREVHPNAPTVLMALDVALRTLGLRCPLPPPGSLFKLESMVSGRQPMGCLSSMLSEFDPDWRERCRSRMAGARR